MLAAFGVAVYELEDASRFREIDADLQARVSALSRTIREIYREESPPPADNRDESTRPFPPTSSWDHGPATPPPPPPGRSGIRTPPPPRSPPGDRLRGELQVPAKTAALFGPQTGFYFVIWSHDGAVLRRSENASTGIPPPNFSDRDTLPHLRTRGVYRELVHCSGFGDCVMAGHSVAGEIGGAATLAWLLFAIGGAVLLIGVAVGWWLTSRAIQPIQEIGAAASRISAGKLSWRVRVTDPDNELGRLATLMNAMFARLETAFTRQQQFTSDAAHELRTPLAVMISEAQTTLARPRSSAEYRQSLEDCLDAAQQMQTLTDTLLDFTRLDTDNGASQRTEIDLAEIASHCIQQLQPAAAVRQVTLKSALAQMPIVSVRERMQLVIINLLNNAIGYNRPGGEVVVTTKKDQIYAILRVADTGIGIGPADLSHIFERFYRADKARSHVEGHAGLGLAICKSILDAERGTIHVESELGRGTVFTIRIPVFRLVR